MSVKISVRPNGPLIVEGEVEIIDPTGAKVELGGKTRLVMCRCGMSSTKPFCDSSHKDKFQAAEAAVAPK